MPLGRTVAEAEAFEAEAAVTAAIPVALAGGNWLTGLKRTCSRRYPSGLGNAGGGQVGRGEQEVEVGEKLAGEGGGRNKRGQSQTNAEVTCSIKHHMISGIILTLSTPKGPILQVV